MPVQINEVIIRAIITNDDKNATAKTQTVGKSDEEDEQKQFEILELIEEVIKSKKER
ncbi:MAG TPA: DUF5908 family protein [Chitinophagaceae bacterium]